MNLFEICNKRNTKCFHEQLIKYVSRRCGGCGDGEPFWFFQGEEPGFFCFVVQLIGCAADVFCRAVGRNEEGVDGQDVDRRRVFVDGKGVD